MSSSVSRQLERARVLVADDNEEQRLLLRTFLRDIDADFEFVEDGAQVIDAYQRALSEHRPYNLLVLDVVMPQMTGLRAAEIIRNELGDKQTPIRFLTAELNVTGATQLRADLADGKIWFKDEQRGGAEQHVVENALSLSKLDVGSLKAHIVEALLR